MKSAAGLAVLLAAGCSPWMEPPERVIGEVVRLQPGVERPTRLRVRIDIESPWLSGVFEGAVLVKPGPVVRAQFFPDLGGKVLDLVARPDRITGYFPMTHQGIDCAVPDDVVPHPILFIGLHLLERAAPITRERVTGWFSVSTGEAVRIRSIVEGATETLFLSVHQPTFIVWRKLRWMYGIEWKETPETPDRFTVLAPNFRLKLEVLDRQNPENVPDSAFQLSLPPDVMH